MLALLGIVIAKPLKGDSMAGNIIALCSGVTYAGMVTFMRYEGRDESASMVVWYMGWRRCCFCLPFLYLDRGEILRTESYPSLGLELPILLWVVALGAFSTRMAYLFISLVLKNISANVYSLVDIIVSPVVAAVFGYLVFEEVPSKNMILGGLLLLLSGFWLSWNMQKQIR